MRVLLTNGDFLVQPKAGAQQVNTVANTCAQCIDNWPKYIDTHTGRQTAQTHTYTLILAHTCLLAQGLGKHCAACSHLEQAHSITDNDTRVRVVRWLAKALQTFLAANVFVCHSRMHVRVCVCVCLWIGNANVSCEWQCQCKSARTQREWRNQRIKSRNFNYK